MKKYTVLIFDLFDTLVDFDFRRLPLLDKNGVRSRTTGREVYGVFSKYYPEITFEEFYRPFIDSYRKFQDLKKREYREYPNRERFRIMLADMEIPDSESNERMLNGMVTAHMDGLSSCVIFPVENMSVLDYAADKGYRLSLISNFDYAPTARDILERYDLTQYFEVIIISEDVGWRKPKRIIFERALERLDTNPSEVLFTGDNFDADVVGAKKAGMDAVWINRNNITREPGGVKPDYTIRRLPELIEII